MRLRAHKESSQECSIRRYSTAGSSLLSASRPVSASALSAASCAAKKGAFSSPGGRRVSFLLPFWPQVQPPSGRTPLPRQTHTQVQGAALVSPGANETPSGRSEEHTSELQSLRHLVCRLLL